MTIRDMVREILDEESAASKAAKKAGLVHLGFGRYGPKKGDKATHVSKGGKLVSVGGDTGGGEPEDKPFGGDTGTDADFQGKPPDDRYASYDDMTAMLDDPDEPEYRTDDPARARGRDDVPKEPLARGTKVTASWKGLSGKQQEIPDGQIEDVKYSDSGHEVTYVIRWNNGNNLIELPADKVKGEEPKEIGRTGKELGETKMMKLESLLKENPAAMAAVQKMTAIKLQGKGKRKVQATTALKDKDHPSHTKAVGIFQKLKDRFSKKKEDEPEFKDYTPTQSDTDFYRKQYAARTGKELGENKMNESIKFHTISGNKRFMTKTALPILRKYGAKNVTVNQVAGDFLEIRFPIDSNKLKKLDKELKRKNKTAYGGIVENRRDTMKEAILRKIIREEIRRIVKEDDDKSAFNSPIPAGIERYMKKFIAAVQGARLNRRRTGAILGRVVAAMNIEPSDLMKYVRMVKKGL